MPWLSTTSRTTESFDFSDENATTSAINKVCRVLQRQVTDEDDPESMVAEDGFLCATPDLSSLADSDEQKRAVRKVLDVKVQEAMEQGLSPQQGATLREILQRHEDEFRLEICLDALLRSSR